MIRFFAATLALLAGVISADAGVRKVCNAWTHECWLENDAGEVVRRTIKRHAKPRRKPEVRAYVKRERNHTHEREDDDRISCKPEIVVIGDARPSESSAREDAEAVFMRSVRYRYGESYLSIANARDYASRCARASITEIVGQVMTRCEIKARPCSVPFESR